jgi:hypothetical protein
MLQLASGSLKAALYQLVITLLLLIPLLFFAIRIWGMTGAAALFLLSNLAGVLISGYCVHQQFLKERGKSWYLFEALLPLCGLVCVALVAKWFFPAGLSQASTACCLVFLAATLFLTAILLSPFSRLWLKNRVRKSA